MEAVIIVFSIIGLYFLPIIVASSRKNKSIGSIAVINIFLGWTLLGWVIALAMAYSSNTESNKEDLKQEIVQLRDELREYKKAE